MRFSLEMIFSFAIWRAVNAICEQYGFFVVREALGDLLDDLIIISDRKRFDTRFVGCGAFDGL
jgi:hypothetical protein